ncbi:MAG: 8-amino-7-oxononanoate synthase [Steroidobacteraceae bacterium]
MSTIANGDSRGSLLEPVLCARLAEFSTARYRRRRRIEIADIAHPVRVVVEGRSCVSFCSNDYLGLAAHPAVIAACSEAAHRYGVGSGASHLVTGHGPEHDALEEELARFTGRERALVFSTGYMANLGIASALFSSRDRVLEDRLNHASLLDAGLGSGARVSRYAHADATALERRLARAADKGATGCTWVLTDGVFSMDGDVAPLAALARAATQHGAHLVVDDAHGMGVLGRNGRGSVDAAGLDGVSVPILMGTLGKAFGTFGAFVAGSGSLIELLIQKSRTYIYTTALPPPIAAATRASLRISQEEEWRRERLHRHIARFREHATAKGWPLLASATPIQPLILGSEEAALGASAELLEAGVLASAIRPPTVPEGSSRLRITLSAAHEDSDLDCLLAALTRLKALQNLA